jgi:hypothetical protein
MRLAAQLSLSDPGGIVLLSGRYATCAKPLAEIVDVTCILLDAPIDLSPQAVNIEVMERLPLVDRALRGAAVDQSRSSLVFLADIARSLRHGGRLVTPASAQRPDGVRLLAKDDLESVLERLELPTTVQLRRERRSL